MTSVCTQNNSNAKWGSERTEYVSAYQSASLNCKGREEERRRGGEEERRIESVS